MGGRGGGSGRGGGGVTSRPTGTTGHLAGSYVGEEKAIQMLMKETGLTRQEAEKTYYALDSYFGSNYYAIRSGHPPSAAEKAKLIDKALKKARVFNDKIYRGIHLSTEGYEEWAKQLKKGSTIDMKGISSWSSKKSVAESFAHKGTTSGQSVIFTVSQTKHAVPVQHLSHFGKSEAEVLAPSSVKYKVSSHTTKGNITYVNLQEVA